MVKFKNILSLFDGTSILQEALKRSNIVFEKYYSSEIDKYSITIANKNFPNTIQLGDINKWMDWDIDWHSIDFIVAGFPCQSWSIAGKQKGDNDERGKLLWIMLDILNYVRKLYPDVIFLFENVKMKKEFQDYVDNAIGVKPILIDSALVSAQSRKRNYWTNIKGIQQPNDRGILLKDIIHENCDEILDVQIDNFNVNPSGIGMNGDVYSINKDKSRCLTTNKSEGQKVSVCLSEYIVPFDKTLQILDKEVEKGKLGYFRKDSQANRVYYVHGKAVTLCGESGGGAAKMGQYLFGCITPDRINKQQNGQRFNEGRKFYTLTAQDKHGILIEGYIRKLTPVECERLQTLPDGYTESVSNSQRNKMLGNGFNCETIAHILSYIKDI